MIEGKPEKVDRGLTLAAKHVSYRRPISILPNGAQTLAPQLLPVLEASSFMRKEDIESCYSLLEAAFGIAPSKVG